MYDNILPHGMVKPTPYQPLMDNKKHSTAAQLNVLTYKDYFDRLHELSINMFRWNNLPETIDERYLELILSEYGMAVFFQDDVLGYLTLTCAIGGTLNVYRIPTERRAYATNGYQKPLTENDSVLIFNNYLHTPSMSTLALYAMRLTEIERTIDVNVRGQKTPVAILCDESQLLTMKNVYKKYEGNEPIIMGAKNLDLKTVTSINTVAPYVADKLNILKRQVWNEALTFCGIENNTSDKKERLVSEEVLSSLGAVEAQRNVMLNAREQACKQINSMFGLNVSVEFRMKKEEVLYDGELYDNDTGTKPEGV